MCVADRPVLAAVGQTVPGPGAAPRADVSGGVGGLEDWRDSLRSGYVVGHRRYSVQTLQAAVQRVLQGESVRSVAFELRLPRETLRRHADKAKWAITRQSSTADAEMKNYLPDGMPQ